MINTLLISVLLIAYPMLSTPPSYEEQDVSAICTENEHLDVIYAFLKTWLGVHPNGVITMEQFYTFVIPTVVNMDLVNGYFMLYPSERIYKDNIHVLLFRSLIRHICIGNGKDIVRYTDVLRTRLRSIRRGREEYNAPTEDEHLDAVYEYVKNWLGIHPNNNITLDQFFSFVGYCETYATSVNNYFTLFSSEIVYIDNINVLLFKSLIRVICIKTPENPVHFTYRLVREIERNRNIY